MGTSAHDHIFSMPAVTPVAALPSVSVSTHSLRSCGDSLLLTLDSCCSVSLVSENHEDFVAKSNHGLVFNKLEQPIPDSVARLSTSLRVVGTMQVLIIELEGLECVLSHVTRNDYGKSKWYQHVGKKTARSHSGECFVAVFLAFSNCFHKFRACISEIV